ncbi:unnamed protein product [Sphagnum jensenii]|uniref:Uncharacterized protein n=1 Tax=Sphagnum jensenii TaxID=128206 RepID=A0ABP1ABM2_9BRYO
MLLFDISSTKYLPQSTASKQIQTPVRCLDDFQCLLTSAFPKSSCGKGPKKLPVLIDVKQMAEWLADHLLFDVMDISSHVGNFKQHGNR